MSGSTPNYHWTLPTIGGDASSWGSEINADLGLIDVTVNNIETNLANVGGYVDQNGLYAVRGPDGGSYAVVEFYGQTSSLRWQLFEDSTPESGGNAGSNFGLNAFDDGGNYLGAAFTISRASQRISLAQNPASPMDAATKQYVDTAGSVPIGSIMLWGSPTPPFGWTWCNGAHYAASALPALFNVIGGNFFWDGTNFGLPSCSGQVVIGYDGGSWTLGRQDGEYSHTLSSAEMPAHSHADAGHSHSITDPQHTHGNVLNPGGSGGAAGSGLHLGTTDPAPTGISIQTGYANIGSAGSGGAHNNMQPSIVLGYIIRYA